MEGKFKHALKNEKMYKTSISVVVFMIFSWKKKTCKYNIFLNVDDYYTYNINIIIKL